MFDPSILPVGVHAGGGRVDGREGAGGRVEHAHVVLLDGCKEDAGADRRRAGVLGAGVHAGSGRVDGREGLGNRHQRTAKDRPEQHPDEEEEATAGRGLCIATCACAALLQRCLGRLMSTELSGSCFTANYYFIF